MKEIKSLRMNKNEWPSIDSSLKIFAIGRRRTTNWSRMREGLSEFNIENGYEVNVG